MVTSKPLSNLQPIFSCGLMQEKLEMRSQLAARIYKNGVQTFACGAGFQAANGCVAQHSRRFPTFRADFGSLLALITRQHRPQIPSWQQRVAPLRFLARFSTPPVGEAHWTPRHMSGGASGQSK